MPRPSKEVKAAREAAAAANAAVDATVEASQEKQKRKRSVRAATFTDGVPAAPSGEVGVGVPMTEEDYEKHRTVDAASAKAFKAWQEIEKKRANGENMAGLHFNLEPEDRYAMLFQHEGQSGIMKVRIKRMTNPEAELEDVPMRSFPTLSDLREYVRGKHWDGRETEFHWECRSQRPTPHAQGEFKLFESPEAMARWEERKLKAEAIRAQAPASPWGAWGAGGMTPGGLQVTPGVSGSLPPGYVMSPWGPMPQAAFAAMGGAPGGTSPDITMMLAQAALGKGNSDPATLALLAKIFESKMSAQQPAQQQPQQSPWEQILPILEVLKDKPDNATNTLLFKLLEDKLRTPVPQQEDPLDRVKKVLEMFGGGSGGLFGGEKKSEIDSMIEATEKAKKLAAAVGFKSPDDKKDDDGPVVHDKDGKIDGIGTVVKIAADNMDSIGGGLKFLIEAGTEMWTKSKEDRRKFEQAMIDARHRGNFVAEEKARLQAEVKAREVEVNREYIEQLREAARLKAEMDSPPHEIGVRETTTATPAPVYSPRSAVASAQPAPAPSPVVSDDDDESPGFWPETPGGNEDDEEEPRMGAEA